MRIYRKLALAAGLAAVFGMSGIAPAIADEGEHRGWEKHGLPPGQAKKHRHDYDEEGVVERPVVVAPAPVVVPQQPTVVLKPSSNTTVIVPLNIK